MAEDTTTNQQEPGLYQFSAMSRDMHPINQEHSSLWDAFNIRLTNREGNSLLSITNEKSTKEIDIPLEYEDRYVGHCCVGDYLVLFLRRGDDSVILRVSMDKDYLTEILYYDKGNALNLSEDHPLQCLHDYEHELIQKVYWVDGINNPRVINVAKPELKGAEYDSAEGYTAAYPDAPFSFVQKMSFKETALFRSSEGYSSYLCGTVQYMLTYGFKYGQETSPFAVSEILNIFKGDRGGSLEEKGSNVITITVENPDTRFDYVRIYSIHRTSVDITPQTRRVTDIELSPSTSRITFTDRGDTGDIITDTDLLYKGGKDIIAGCMESKDNVLFLGDIKFNRPYVKSIDGIDNWAGLVRCAARHSYYDKCQLETNTSTFKKDQTYRLGFQLLHDSGEWSEPVFIEDKRMTERASLVSEGHLRLPIFTMNLAGDEDSVRQAQAYGYRKIRPVVVLPRTEDKEIIAQGILSPTVFNPADRRNNSPFAQASWFLRPYTATEPYSYDEPGAVNGSMGSYPENRHYHNLCTDVKHGRSIEIQNHNLEGKLTSKPDHLMKEVKRIDPLDPDLDINKAVKLDYIYFVDHSIVTMNSPELEFNDFIKQLLYKGADYELNLVGLVPWNSNESRISVLTETPTLGGSSAGFLPYNPSSPEDGGRSFIAGLNYNDYVADDVSDLEIKTIYEDVNWMVHAFNKTGSLTNDINRNALQGTRTSVLKKKVIANKKVSHTTFFSDRSFPCDTGSIEIFDSEVMEGIKLNDDLSEWGKITYYGNVDTMSISKTGYYQLLTSVKGKTLKRCEFGVKYPRWYLDMFTGFLMRSTDMSGRLIMTPKDDIGNAIGDEIKLNVVSVVDSYTEAKGTEARHGRSTEFQFTYTGQETATINGEEVSLYNTEFMVELDDSDGVSEWGNAFHATITARTEGGLIFNSGRYQGRIGWMTFIAREEYDSPTADPDKMFIDDADLMSQSHLLPVSNGDIGDFYSDLRINREGIRIKYKSVPHAVTAFNTNPFTKYKRALPVLGRNAKETGLKRNDLFWLAPEAFNPDVLQDAFMPSGMPVEHAAYSWLAELRVKGPIPNQFGGTTEEAFQSNIWIPAGEAVDLEPLAELDWIWGDTWYQRYECLKTYPFTPEDENQIIEIASFMVETYTNIEGRYDRNRSLENLDISPRNYNLVNKVYSQSNNFFSYTVMDEDYYKVSHFPSQFLWTSPKNIGSEHDIWTNLHMANVETLDSTNGRLAAIKGFGEKLVALQETAVNLILFNVRVQIQPTDGVPIEIASGMTVEGTRIVNDSVGCQDKFNVEATANGIYFMDNLNCSFWNFNEQLLSISQELGSMYWFRDNQWSFPWQYRMDTNRPGIRLAYDPRYQDLYLTQGMGEWEEQEPDKWESLCFSEVLKRFTSRLSYGGGVLVPWKSRLFSIADRPDGRLALWECFAGNGYNSIYGKDRPFFFSFVANDLPYVTKVFDHMEFRSDKYADMSSILMGEKYSTHTQEGMPFNYVRVQNEYQDSGEVLCYSDDKYRLLDNIPQTSLRKKFRMWRILLPRHRHTRQRIRNPWAVITLGRKDFSDAGEDYNLNINNDLTIFHGLQMKYSI